MTDQNPPAGPVPGYPAPGNPPAQGPQYPAPGYPAPGYPTQGPQYPTPQYPGQGPQYPAPGYPAAGYPPGPQYPYAAPPNGGGLSWALGFLVFAFPYVGAVAAGISMAAVYGSVAWRGQLAAQNARSAANWGLTFLLASIVLPLAHFILLAVATDELRRMGFFPLGTLITLYFVIVLLHIVLTIVGTVRASTGRVMRVPFAIPFIRG